MIWRLVIVLLVTAVSPVAATVCEVACASPGHSGHGAAQTAAVAQADDHAHHHHDMTMPAPPVAPVQALEVISSSNCDPIEPLPARVRAVEYDAAAHSALSAAWVFQAPVAPSRFGVRDAAAPPPLLPPLHAIPLRI